MKLNSTDSPSCVIVPGAELKPDREQLKKKKTELYLSFFREQPNAELKPDPMRVATRRCHRSLG